jgi:UDP-N-acetylenolpyruvoylglucosamine reductase
MNLKKNVYSSDIKFSYRGSNLDNKLIFISATFRGKKNNKPNIQKKINNLVKKNENANSKLQNLISEHKQERKQNRIEIKKKSKDNEKMKKDQTHKEKS